MKKTVGYLLKCILAAIISMVLLSLFYNPPIATQQPDWITNYKLISNSKWCYMLEGFGYGEIDNLGYNNAYYDNCNQPDIVFIGSSHMESLQVPQNANCVYLLNEKFDKDGLPDNDFKCLNLGISGHFFEVTSSNFEYVVNKFKGTKYIVIETTEVEFSPSKLDGIMEGEFHSPLKNKGLIYEMVKKNPYFRLMHKKINETVAVKNEGNGVENEVNSASNDNYDINIYTDKMNVVLNRISRLSEGNGIAPIILMHERFFIDEGGNIVTENNETYKNVFKKCCEDNGIKVIDVVPAMIAKFKESFEFSYGFSNSAPGEGHLNKTGHRIIAETVYEKINEMEEDK